MNTALKARDFPALIASAASEAAQIALTAGWIQAVFERFYADFQRLTWLAKSAFESRDHPAAVACA